MFSNLKKIQHVTNNLEIYHFANKSELPILVPKSRVCSFPSIYTVYPESGGGDGGCSSSSGVERRRQQQNAHLNKF